MNNQSFELSSTGNMTFEEGCKSVKQFEDSLTYKGVEFFHTIYMEILIPFASDELEINKLSIREEYFDDEEGESETEEVSYKITGQECYLGYIPSEDIFVCGWDMDNYEPNIVCVKLDKDLNPSKVYKPFINGCGMFYQSKDYDQLKKHNQVIDIRLD